MSTAKTAHLQELQRGEPYAPAAPPWMRIVMPRTKSKGDPICYPWHYIDYTRVPEPSNPRVPLVCGSTIDAESNKHKRIELSVTDPPAEQFTCLRCIEQMRQAYEPAMSKIMTFWLAIADGKRYLLMRQHDMIWCAIEVSHIDTTALDRADPRQVVSDAIEEGRPILTGDAAREPDFTAYKFFGTRVHG